MRSPRGASADGSSRRRTAAAGRFSRTELHRLVIEQGVTDASASTILRWLHGRSLRPWQQRSWIFPRDLDFQANAGRVLDLYVRRFEDPLLHRGEYVICADEKSQPQALARRHATAPAAPGRPTLVEFEHARRHAGLPGRLGRPPRSPVRPLRAQDRDRAVRPPRRTGDQQRALQVGAARVLDRRQRKALTPNDFDDLDALAARITAFEAHYRQVAQPFEWTFTRAKLDALLAGLASRAPHLRLAA